MCFPKTPEFCICPCLQTVWMLRDYNTLKVHVEWKNVLVKSRMLQALKIIQKSLSVTLELNLFVIHTCFSGTFLPAEDNINVDFWKWDLGRWCSVSDGWHIWAHYIPNLCHQHCRAEIITLHHQTHQKGSTGAQLEHAVLSASLSLLLMSRISKLVFGRLNLRDNAMKIFWSRYHCDLLIRTLSLHTGLSFHTTLTKGYYFHSFQDQKLQNLLSWQHPLLWIVLPNRVNLAEVP